jgi:integrase
MEPVMKIKINAKNVKTLPLSDEGRATAYSDGRGLSVVVEPGAKGITRSFNFRFTFAGKPAIKRMKHVDEMTLDEARTQAGKYRDMVSEGKDPRREVDATAAGQVSFKQYLDANWDDITGGKPRDHYRWNYNMDKVSKLFDRAIATITHDDVYEAIKPFWRSNPATAPEVLQKAGLVFRHAKVRRLRADNPADVTELRDLGLKKVDREVAHHRALPFAELPAFLQKLAYQPELSARCLEWCILTAARSGEAREARWSWRNKDHTVVTIPAEFTKTGIAHAVPLPTQLTAMLGKLPRTGDLLFPSPQRAGHEPYFPHALLEMLTRVLSDETPTVHGFRTTFRDYAAALRLEEDAVLELCLGHEIGNDARKAYRGNDLVERRRPVMQAYADFALGAAPKGKVVPFKKSA